MNENPATTPSMQEDRQKDHDESKQGLFQNIALAAILCMLFTAVAFQPLRDSGYEAEKLGFLVIFVSVIIGVWLINISNRIANRKPLPVDVVAILRSSWRSGVFSQPLTRAVTGFMIISTISTLFSLSPALSFWGEPERVQGLFALLMLFCLYLAAASLTTNTRHKLLTALTPALLLTAIPICTWQIVGLLNGVSRMELGSTLGNPNFLSSWVAIVLLITVPQIIHRIAAAGSLRNWPIRFWMSLIVYSVPIGLLIFALVLTTSRGALFGLIVGAIVAFVSYCAITRRKKLLIALLIGTLTIGIPYGLTSLWVKNNSGETIIGDRWARLFRPYDPARMVVWQAASKVVILQTQPVFTLTSQPDPYAFFRPLLGYGPETVEQLQSRYGDPFGPGVMVNSFHNQIFDLLVMQGWLGLLAWCAVLECALYTGLTRLGLLRIEQIGVWLGWQFAGAVAGVILLWILAAPTPIGALMPIGGALGTVIALILWIGRQAFRTIEPDQSVRQLSPETIFVISLLAIAISNWVDNQFSFTQGATLHLMWLLLGLIVSFAGQTTDTYSDQSVGPTKDASQVWAVSTLAVGLFTLNSFGVALSSQYFSLETGNAQIPLMLGMVFVVGMVGAWFQADDHKPLQWIKWTVVISVVWALFALFKTIIVSSASSWLTTTISAFDPTLFHRNLASIMMVLAVPGVVAAVVTVVAFTITTSSGNSGTSDRAYPRRLALVILCLLICLIPAFLFHVTRYGSSVLHNIGNTALRSVQVDPFTTSPDVSVAALESALRYDPTNAPLRLHLVQALTASLVTNDTPESRAQVVSELETLFRIQPYFVNGLEWRNFARNYKPLIGTESKP